MAYDYVDNTGIIIADTSNIRDEVTQEFKDNFGDDLVTDNGSPASILITSQTTARINTLETMALFTNQINPDFAGGIFLDAIGGLTDFQRRQETSTTVTATVTGVVGTIIPLGSVAETDDGNRFVTVSEVVIPVGGSIDVGFQSEEKGAIPCPANSLTTISDGGVLGWETVNNSLAGILGLETQSDEESRIDRKLTLAKGAKAIPYSITSGLYAIDNVLSLKFRENYTNATDIIDNVSMVAHSIYLCIDGGTDDQIATALYNYKTLGCAYNNGSSSNPIEYTLTAPDTGQDYTVKFDRPDEINIKIQITVKASASSTDPTTNIKNAILDYANSSIRTDGFKVGIDISPIEIAQNVAVGTGYFVTDCQVTKQSIDIFQRETIDLEIWEKGVTSSSLIEVILL